MNRAWAKRLFGAAALAALTAGCVGQEPTLPTAPSCAAPLVLCGESCVDTSADALNCGACDMSCDATHGEACSGGTCSLAPALGCATGTTACGGLCVDTKTNAAHCGDCKTACDTSDGQVCSNGSCALACTGGTTQCNADCIDTDTDPDHCGKCGAACSDGQVCSAGKCALACTGGTSLCGKSCVDFTSDPLHCGDCRTTCATNAGETCADGKCAFACTGGTSKCGDACVDTDVDPAHCGACDVSCSADATCSGGQCACADGYDGDGQTCTDIDECAGDNDCSPSGDCINVPGGYACSCRDDQSGDGTTCAGFELVTVGVSGKASSGTPSALALSDDGRYVAFVSTGADLADAQTGAESYALGFERDMRAKTTALVSVNDDGTAADGPLSAEVRVTSATPLSAEIAVSGDGNFVAFTTAADNLGSDPMGKLAVFVRDIAGATTLPRSDASSGTPHDSGAPKISADGSTLVFSSARQLTGTATHDLDAIYERSLGGSEPPVLLSVDDAGDLPTAPTGCSSQATVAANKPSVSADGKRVVFESSGVFTDDPDSNCASDVFLRDLTNPKKAVTLLLTGNADGEACSDESSLGSGDAAISADGNFVAFASSCVDLLPTPDQLPYRDVFVRDLTKNTLTRVSVTTKGIEGDNDSDKPQISADGRYVAFSSLAANLVAGDTNQRRDLFVRDMLTNKTVRVDLAANGQELPNGDELSDHDVLPLSPPLFALAANGAAVAFVANLTGLGDPGAMQIYLRYLR